MKINDALNEKFDIDDPPEPEELPAVQAPAQVLAPEPTAVATIEPVDQVAADLNKARDTITAVIDQGMSGLKDLARVAKDSEHPRAYEVLATLLKTMSETAKDLVDLQEKKRDLNREDEAHTPQAIKTQQNIFVGTTHDLITVLNQKKNAIQTVEAEIIPED